MKSLAFLSTLRGVLLVRMLKQLSITKDCQTVASGKLLAQVKTVHRRGDDS